MLRIQIENENVKVKKGISGRTGKPYEIREQEVVVHGLGRFPQQLTVSLPDDVERYRVGLYEVTTPFVVGRYGFDVSRDLGLVAVKAEQGKAA